MNERGKFLLSVMAAAIVVVGGLYGAMRLLEAESAATRAAAQQAAAKAAMPSAPPRTATNERPVSSARPSDANRSATRSAGVPAPGGPGAIYRCQQGGRTVYSDAPCDGAPSQLVDVRPTSGFQPPPRGPAASAQAPSPQPAPAASESGAPGAQSQPNAASNKAACAAIERAIEQVDAAARRGQSIPEQDRLRAQRKALVDQRAQFECHLVSR